MAEVKDAPITLAELDSHIASLEATLTARQADLEQMRHERAEALKPKAMARDPDASRRKLEALDKREAAVERAIRDIKAALPDARAERAALAAAEARRHRAQRAYQLGQVMLARVGLGRAIDADDQPRGMLEQRWEENCQQADALFVQVLADRFDEVGGALGHAQRLDAFALYGPHIAGTLRQPWQRWQSAAQESCDRVMGWLTGGTL